MKETAALFALMFVSALVAPGQAAHTAPNAARLNGNWRLVAVDSGGLRPELYVNVAVGGDRIIGDASVDIVCPGEKPQHYKSQFPLLGKIDTDGGFVLRSEHSIYPVEFRGSIAVGDNGWKGTYSISPPTEICGPSPLRGPSRQAVFRC